jgi:hypothetical protein
MKHLYFKKMPYDYGAEVQPFLNGVKRRGIGSYDNKDAKVLMELHGNLVEELSDEQFEELKKKLTIVPTSFRAFRTLPQDSTKNPNAVYAEKENKESDQSKAEDLVEVAEAEVEDPLEGKE